MTTEFAIAAMHDAHLDCCIAGSYQENHCRLDITGLESSLLATLHGSSFQSNHNWRGRLCDLVIFGRLNGYFVCAVELKGGQSADTSVAIEQIQGGLDLAVSLLQSRAPQKFYPLLLYSGSMPRKELDALRKNMVSYRGKKERIDRIDCGSRLLDYLNRQR